MPATVAPTKRLDSERPSYGRLAPWPKGVRPWLRSTLLALLTLAALVLAARRLGGALQLPLSTATLVLAGFAAAVAAVTVRRLGPRNVLFDWWPTAALAVFALSLSVAGARFAALAMLWGVVLLAEVVSRWVLDRFPPVGVVLATRLGEVERRPAARLAAVELQPMARRGERSVVEQQLTRTRTAAGEQCVQGWLQVPLAAGQRTAIAHVAFCPPLSGVPQFTCRQAAGPAVRIKVAQLLAVGVRLELKLSDPLDEAAEVRIEFEASSASSKPAAD